VAGQWPAREAAEAGSGPTGRSPSGPPLSPAGPPTVGPDIAPAEIDGALDPPTMLAPAQGGSGRQPARAVAQQGPVDQQWPARAWPGERRGRYGRAETSPQPRAGWPQAPARQQRRRSRGLLVGVVVGVAGVCIAAAAVAIGVLNHGGPSNNGSHSSPPTSTAKRQAS